MMRPGNLGSDDWSLGTFGKGGRRGGRRGQHGRGRPGRGMAHRGHMKARRRAWGHKRKARPMSRLEAELARLQGRRRCGWYCQWKMSQLNKRIAAEQPPAPIDFMPATLPPELTPVPDFPAKAKGMPVKARGFPAKAQGMPAKAKGLPVKARGYSGFFAGWNSF